jgi:hypothetical protein
MIFTIVKRTIPSCNFLLSQTSNHMDSRSASFMLSSVTRFHIHVTEHSIFVEADARGSRLEAEALFHILRYDIVSIVLIRRIIRIVQGL